LGDFLIEQLMKEDSFRKLYKDLRGKYGRPSGQWVLWCKRPKTEQERQEVIMEAVLAQRTNWKNVGLAMKNLKKARVKSLKALCRVGKKKLAPLIKPSGFYQSKTDYLFSLAGFILKNYGDLETMKKQDARELREKLLELKGIGPETADSILLYALDKPVFVIDEYTRRLMEKKTPNLSYDILQRLFEDNFKKDFRLYQDFHALIVIDAKSK